MLRIYALTPFFLAHKLVGFRCHLSKEIRIRG